MAHWHTDSTTYATAHQVQLKNSTLHCFDARNWVTSMTMKFSHYLRYSQPGTTLRNMYHWRNTKSSNAVNNTL